MKCVLAPVSLYGDVFDFLGDNDIVEYFRGEGFTMTVDLPALPPIGAYIHVDMRHEELMFREFRKNIENPDSFVRDIIECIRNGVDCRNRPLGVDFNVEKSKGLTDEEIIYDLCTGRYGLAESEIYQHCFYVKDYAFVPNEDFVFIKVDAEI